MPDAANHPYTHEGAGAFAFRLLGPLEIAIHGRTVDLPRRKQRLLLTLLLLRGGEVVSTDQLVDQLWGETPPKAAVSSLQNLVSEVRKLLGSEVVRTRAAGYSLGVERETVDVHRFEQLLADEHHDEGAEGRSERLREALSLWRGPPLLEFAGEPFARVESARLVELRTVAREELVDAELELGHHAKLVSELETMVIEQPLRERLRAQLMIALYRSGRQAEALAAYQDARRMLADELGLEPSEELQQLERAILTQDPALARPDSTGSGRRSPAPSGPIRMRRLRPLTLAAALGALVLILVAAAGITRVLLRDPAGRVEVVPNSIAVVDIRTNDVIADVEMGNRPVAVAFGEGAVWVANADDGTVSRVDPTTRKVTRSIRVGTDLRDLTTGFGSIWVADGKNGTVTRIDPELKRPTRLRLTHAAETSVPPVSWIAAGAGSVWATRGDTLFEIDPMANRVLTRTRIPPATGLTAGLGAAWVVTDDQRLLQVVPDRNPKTVIKTMLSHRALAPTVGAGSVWLIVYHETGEIWRIDPDSGAVNIIRDAGRYPLDLAVSDERGYVWAVDSTGAVVRINPNIELTAAEIRTAPTIQSAIAVGAGFVWITVQD
jgi:YVTN family beta-propeller protein